MGAESNEIAISGQSPLDQPKSLNLTTAQKAMRLLMQGLSGLSEDRKKAILADIHAGKPLGRPDEAFGVDIIEFDDFFDADTAQCQSIPGSDNAYVYNAAGALQIIYLLSKLFPNENIRMRIESEQRKHVREQPLKYSELGSTRGVERASEVFSIKSQVLEDQLDEESPEYESMMQDVKLIPLFDNNIKGMWSSDGIRAYPVIFDKKGMPTDTFFPIDPRLGLMIYPSHGDPDKEFFR